MASFSMKSNKQLFKEALEEQVVKALTECGIEAVRFAKTALTDQGAVDTGNLRNSVTYCVGGESPGISSYRSSTTKSKYSKKPVPIKTGSYSGGMPKEHDPCVYVGTNVSYARKIEFGSGRMRARPYIKPAVSEHSDRYNEIIKKELKG